MHAHQQKRKYNRHRMRDNHGARLQFGGKNLPQLTFHPGPTHHSAGLIFKSVGKVHNSATGLLDVSPVLACAFCIRREESKIHVLELLGANALNESNLVLERFKLAERFIIVQQLDLSRWEVALIQHLGNFLAPQGSRADDRDAVETMRRFWVD